MTLDSIANPSEEVGDMGWPKKMIKKDRGSHAEGGRVLQRVSLLKPYLIVFTASTCGMVIEIVAARILAPSIGVSLYTWTSIIGVVLAGISIGNYVGGRLADRFPSPKTLGLILLASGIFSLSVLLLVNPISEAFQSMPLIPRIIFVTATLFLLPSLVLGMVTPVVIKLRLCDLTRTGNVVGKIYAISTAGAIFGTFVTGFVLIQWIGTRSIILMVAVVLLLMALAFGNLWRAKIPTFACLALFLVIGGFAISNGAVASDYLRESNYYSISVEDRMTEGQRVKFLHLDALMHSMVCLEDPTFLGTYDKIFADIATYVAQRNPNLRVLIIGGGGYTMPRYLEEIYPQSTVEVIEIDPEVTRVAFDYLGLSPDTRIVTYNEDARMVVPKLPEGQYDLVIGDTFNDYSVPYHLTTREFNEQIQALMNDDGIYATHVIDKLHSGSFLRAYVNTLQQTFPYVYVICDSCEWHTEDDTRKLYVVVGSFQPLSSESLSDANTRAGRGSPVSLIMPNDVFTSWLNARENILLTDDYAPVDNMVAFLHLEKGRLTEVEEHYKTGVELTGQGKLDEAIDEYNEAIRLNPGYAMAYNNRGNAYAELGQFERGIEDYDEAIRLNPGYAMAYNNRGTSYVSLNQFERGIEDYDEAIRLNPGYAMAYNNRGASYVSLNQFERGIEDYDEAIRLNPGYAMAHYRRGNAYAELGKNAEAIADFEKVITLTDAPGLIEKVGQYIEELSK
ncbi:fused MFS/spermidine synthase [Chloroflexota bacterium]